MTAFMVARACLGSNHLKRRYCLMLILSFPVVLNMFGFVLPLLPFRMNDFYSCTNFLRFATGEDSSLSTFRVFRWFRIATRRYMTFWVQSIHFYPLQTLDMALPFETVFFNFLIQNLWWKLINVEGKTS